MQDLFAWQGWSGLRYLSPLALLWLAFSFGRTLRPDTTPLIERIARRGIASLSAPLCRYTRWLTAIWCGYFLVAAVLSALSSWSGGVTAGHLGLGVLAGSVLLFVGEHWVRARLFPHEAFPSLLQQLRDTRSVWGVADSTDEKAQR